MTTLELAKEIFLAGVESVKPDKLIIDSISRNDDFLFIDNKKFQLSKFDNLYVIGFGKASGLMAKALEDILSDLITDGLVIVKYGHEVNCSKIKIRTAGHPYPDKNGVNATSELLNIVDKTTEKDLIICLISGGGSALFTDVPLNSSLDDLEALSKTLIKSGASIHEINTVRKHLSRLKGGQLSRIVFPATIVSLILSDVIGDNLDVIASGATAPDQSTFTDALSVFDKYKIKDVVPINLLNILVNGERGELQETPKINDQCFSKTINIILGNNKIALDKCKYFAEQYKYKCYIISNALNGCIYNAVKQVVGNAVKLSKSKEKICLLYGGETTLSVTGNGVGGRNQHFALLATKQLKGIDNITLLSAGTDGNDGACNAAGAVVDGFTYDKMIKKGYNPDMYIENFDSYNYFKNTDMHIVIGATNTNVMDLIVVLIQ